MINKDTLTIREWELMGQAYSNLIDNGLVIAVTEYDDFISVVFTEPEAEDE